MDNSKTTRRRNPPPIPLPEPKGTSLGELSRVARGTLGDPFIREGDLPPNGRSAISFLQADPVVPLALPPFEEKSLLERALPVLLGIAFVMAAACVVGVVVLLMRAPGTQAAPAATPPANAAIAAPAVTAKRAPAATPAGAVVPVPVPVPMLVQAPESVAPVAAVAVSKTAPVDTAPVDIQGHTRAIERSMAKLNTAMRRVKMHVATSAAAPARVPATKETRTADPSAVVAAVAAPAVQPAAQEAAPVRRRPSALTAVIDDVVETPVARAEVRTRVSSDEIEPSMKIKRDEIIRCGQSHGISGTIRIRFTVAPTGRVASVTIADHTDGPFLACVAGEVRQLGFRPFEGTTNSFVYPIMIPE